MKIAIDIRSAGGEKAGKGWYTFHLVRSLLQMDNKNQYLLYCKESIAGFEEFPNLLLKSLSGPGIFWHHKVARDCKKENVELFFAPSSYIVPSLLDENIKSIATVHDLVAFLFPDRHNKKATILEKFFLKRAVKKAHQIIAISQNTKKDLLDRFPAISEKITVIPCAASDEFRPIPKDQLRDFAKKTSLPEHFFLSVGTLEPRKNYPRLIEAFHTVHKFFPDYHLIIVGKEGWDFDEIYKTIRQYNLSQNVHLLGYLSNSSLVKLYNLAKALVFPSLYEGFGLPPLEAMQSGCPVITSKISSLPEVVGDSALLVDPHDVHAISGAMMEIIKNPQLSEALKVKVLVQAQKFSMESSAKKLLEIIEKSFS